MVNNHPYQDLRNWFLTITEKKNKKLPKFKKLFFFFKRDLNLVLQSEAFKNFIEFSIHLIAKLFNCSYVSWPDL